MLRDGRQYAVGDLAGVEIGRVHGHGCGLIGPLSRFVERREMIKAPLPCAAFDFVSLDASLKCRSVADDYDVNEVKAELLQGSLDFVPVALVRDRLDDHQRLLGLVGDRRRGGSHQLSPCAQVLEIGERLIGELRFEHVAHELGIEEPPARESVDDESGDGGLADAERPVDPQRPAPGGGRAYLKRSISCGITTSRTTDGSDSAR